MFCVIEHRLLLVRILRSVNTRIKVAKENARLVHICAMNTYFNILFKEALMNMLIRNIKLVFFVSFMMVGLSFFVNTNVIADKHELMDISEFHQIINVINSSDIPDNVKNQLLRDMKVTLIENVRRANIPESTKRTIIMDIESSPLRLKN